MVACELIAEFALQRPQQLGKALSDQLNVFRSRHVCIIHSPADHVNHQHVDGNILSSVRNFLQFAIDGGQSQNRGDQEKRSLFSAIYMRNQRIGRVVGGLLQLDEYVWIGEPYASIC